MDKIQAMINGMNAEFQRERAGSQMTLGRMISILSEMPKDLEVKGLGDLDSYRGYYCDLAFEPSGDAKTVEELLEICCGAMGKVFEGYKGGEYVMGAKTPLWLAFYGDCGDKIMGINKDGTIETEEDE
jgi:hypothetical protein